MHIVALDGFTLNPGDNSWDAINQLGKLTVYDRTPENLIISRAKDADIILVNKAPLSANILDQLPKLKFISVLATGHNIIDVTAARKKNIIISNAPSYSTRSVAQYVFASLLTFIYKPEAHSQSVKKGGWQNSKDFCYWLSSSKELAGQTLGIIGMGKIGHEVTRLADAFGMHVIAFSPTQRNTPNITHFKWQSIKSVFENSDVISLHCPQTPKNTGFVDQSLISNMKPSALLINTARGGLINEIDLADALNKNIISGAILDVLSKEPPTSSNPLLKAQNCQITPHIAWSSIDARKRLMQQTHNNIAAFMKGQPINVVN